MREQVILVGVLGYIFWKLRTESGKKVRWAGSARSLHVMTGVAQTIHAWGGAGSKQARREAERKKGD